MKFSFMKRNDFIKSLQIIKSHLLQAQSKSKPFSLEIKENRQKVFCSCKDSDGESKYLYNSKEEIEYLLASKHISLQSYPCPYEKGWHLTKG